MLGGQIEVGNLEWGTIMIYHSNKQMQLASYMGSSQIYIWSVLAQVLPTDCIIITTTTNFLKRNFGFGICIVSNQCSCSDYGLRRSWSIMSNPNMDGNGNNKHIIIVAIIRSGVGIGIGWRVVFFGFDGLTQIGFLLDGWMDEIMEGWMDGWMEYS